MNQISGTVFAIRNAIHCYTLHPGEKLKYYMENLDMFSGSPSTEAGKTEKPQGKTYKQQGDPVYI